MRSVFVSLLAFIVFSSLGQSLPDSIILKKSKEFALAAYDRAMEGNLHIYSGSEYIAYQPLQDEHPFFLTDEWTNGNILYDGEWFNDVPMLFDLEKGLVVISYYFKGTKMQLNSDRVQEFNLSGHRFINLKQTRDSIEMENGFYDMIYAGKTTIVAKHTKKYFESMRDIVLTQGFKESTQLYLFGQGKYHKVGTKSSVLSILSDKKKELKVFIRQNRLFISEQNESVARVAQYYDSLKP